MLKQAVRDHERTATTADIVTPVPVPRTDHHLLPAGEAVHPRPEARSEFAVRRWYRGWQRSVFTAARFDSWTGEYALAELVIALSGDAVPKGLAIGQRIVSGTAVAAWDPGHYLLSGLCVAVVLLPFCAAGPRSATAARHLARLGWPVQGYLDGGLPPAIIESPGEHRG